MDFGFWLSAKKYPIMMPKELATKSLISKDIREGHGCKQAQWLM
jgi:hypothetical protein